ncbi:hypothetical protein BS47DRAFT_1393281 [Hydnum rufescens UP504]|uniref:Fanconi-associated nuclease n=1 Tax=Hydnum rufescens UP504 TaxID=1448309 RepID=A0A9P6AWQ7_9AGAM|nr:hypothetical protein BS47DRAFT_1393281 [Hydnum rufescens UP504]
MNVADSLPFASGDALEGRQSDSVLPHDFTRDTNDLAASHRESMYTTLLHELITTVVKHESFLFFPPELELLQELNTLSRTVSSIRLSLRTRSKLHRLSDLTVKYTSELGPHLPHCIDELCHASLSRPSVIQNDGNMAINAKAEAGHHASEMVSSSKTSTKERNAVDINQIRPCFARDESSASTEELLNTLKWDEMKKLGVEMKIFRTGMNRETLKSALLDTALKQTTLPLSLFTRIPPRPFKRDSTPPPQSTVVGSKIIINLVSPSIKKQQPGTCNQLIRLRQMILSFETKFIRVSEEMFTLLQRLNLVYFRCTALSSKSILLPLILARSKKRQYPVYEATRTTNVFISRDALIRYEKALRVEDELDKVPDHGSLNRFERAEKVLEIFQTIYNKWKDLANGKECREQRLQNHPGLERFEEGTLVFFLPRLVLKVSLPLGHVLTRIVHKGAQALGHLKRYKEEVHVLRTLLGQETWRKGGRGEWYDRLALVLMRHLKEPQQAMGVLVTALNDPHTHIVCRPRLIRRLAGVEKILKIPSDQCTKCDDVLRKAKITIVREPECPPGNGSFATSRSPFEAHRESEMVHPVGPQTGQHSLWVGMNEEVGVEELALEHYATLGFRGFHSEGRIVHHLFLLLFWSIVFLPIPGAFETSYQIAPLDLGHDSFYHARQAEIQQRLQEIKDGEGPRILEEVDDRERPRKTFAIGARWEQFTKEDTLEISIGGNALALICQVVAQDYSHRSSGVPDLLLWNVRAGKAKFVEVKGPGDVLMETQKVWIDVLLNCGMDVEVCHVREDDEPDKPKGRRQSQKGSKQKSKAVDTYNANLGPDESNQDDYQHTAGDCHNISGSPQNPLVIPDGEANDCPPRHPSNRKRSRIDYESLVSVGSDAKRKRPSSSKL